MARQLKTASGILSIALHPHSPATYGRFIGALYKLKRAVKIRGERYGIISLLDRSESDDDVYTGVITTFTMVDAKSKWFDLSSLQEASEEATRRIVIPPGLYPNPKAFYFLFDLRQHRIYFQHYTEGDVLTPGSAYRIFATLANDRQIVEKFGEAKITIVQSTRGLEQLLSLPVLKEIRITILRPNPDVFADDFEARIAAHLEQTRSRKFEVTYQAEQGGSLKPDDDIRRVGEYALETGRVAVKGRNQQGRVEQSTDQFPDILTDRYDPDEESDQQAFRRLVGRRRRRLQ